MSKLEERGEDPGLHPNLSVTGTNQLHKTSAT